MYKIVVPFILMTTILFAQPQTDISLTVGYNKFNDSDFLRRFRNFYGIRVGVYQYNNSAIQFGYEQANGANCKGLDLKRFYLNGIRYLRPLSGNIKPYGVVTGGYELSNIHAYKPNQLFAGLGAGIRVTLNPRFYSFLESRVLKKIQTGDTDIITTAGIAYLFGTKPDTQYTYAELLPQSVTVTEAPEIIAEETITENLEPETAYSTPAATMHQSSSYYVQLGAFAKTNPRLLVRKIRRQGFHVKIKHIIKNGRDIKLVLSGPYKSRKYAKKELYRLKKIIPDAFIVKK